MRYMLAGISIGPPANPLRRRSSRAERGNAAPVSAPARLPISPGASSI
jgi:hypothetical protein